ncbi:1,2-phenylacetyl-CoA epoxidase subunit PaaC [Undibacterium sp.]|jgi:ring-1,2-phenylacetyl-CoA epoxidase subunit PaaC|uniref:1,2-phenylacetyl-CoA epoxidase subunit PaaC n=1 Tax=Undibacterium sp. TaxID=1914977 RepID=UPI002C332132|nr:1,2-phenylacetyl-CoA epoxidase subunit PaaC [Undibacterium sp.]HTD04957.1 1,2-phenylacetyl-CoA epoxidase subunit PaaC [Undibacterium sp.]
MNNDPHIDYLLRLGDSTLILGQRLSEWCGHGPVLEEDIALGNIALDLIGQARLLLSHAGSLMQPAQSEDSLAYFREQFGFRNFTMLELPNSGLEKGQQQRDYAFAICRNFLFSAYMVLLWQALAQSSDPQLAAIAGKSVKEARYHLRHSSDWMLRFGDGTEESHQRAQRALNALLPYAHEFFSEDAVERQAAADGIAVTGASLQTSWEQLARGVIRDATLDWPASWNDSQFRSSGKAGQHSEHFGFLLAEMQSLARAHPQANW